jgi:zinc protease
MANLKIDEETLNTERDAVLGEYRMGLDDPDSVAFDKLYGTAFTTHPYQYTTIGTEEEIKRFNKADSDYFYRKYYAPNNCVIFVVGDVEPGATVTLIEKYYGGYKPQEIERKPAPTEPKQASERTTEYHHAQLTQNKLLMGYHTPEAKHADQPALAVAQSLLTSGEGALLHSLWVNSGLAVGVGGFVNTFRDPGLFVVSTDLQEGHEPSELIPILESALAEIRGNCVLEAEVERAKNQLLLEVFHQLEDNASLASFMGEYIASAGDPLYAFELLRAIEQVGPADVKRVVGQYLKSENRSVIIGRPKEAE